MNNLIIDLLKYFLPVKTICNKNGFYEVLFREKSRALIEFEFKKICLNSFFEVE